MSYKHEDDRFLDHPEIIALDKSSRKWQDIEFGLVPLHEGLKACALCAIFRQPKQPDEHKAGCGACPLVSLGQQCTNSVSTHAEFRLVLKQQELKFNTQVKLTGLTHEIQKRLLPVIQKMQQDLLEAQEERLIELDAREAYREIKETPAESMV